MTMRYTVSRGGLGYILLAATEAGVCGVAVGDTVAEAKAWLLREFPNQELTRDDAGLRDWHRSLVQALDAGLPAPDLPLDLQRGTPLQKRVWEELCRIPCGEVRTYAAVAQAIGRPTAIRAVARACAINPVSLIVPCHRVIGSDGTLRGYGWGLKRKQKLLDLESSAVAVER